MVVRFFIWYSLWELWVVLLVVGVHFGSSYGPLGSILKVLGVFLHFGSSGGPFGSILRGLVASGAPWAAMRWHSAPPAAQDQIF